MCVGKGGGGLPRHEIAYIQRNRTNPGLYATVIVGKPEAANFLCGDGSILGNQGAYPPLPRPAARKARFAPLFIISPLVLTPSRLDVPAELTRDTSGPGLTEWTRAML